MYERELLAVVYAVQKWGAYLCSKPFIIKTDQKSLKFLLEQRLNTAFQQVWMAKLMGFQFEIQFKEGKTNLAADALSRRSHVHLQAMLFSNVGDNFYEAIKGS